MQGERKEPWVQLGAGDGQHLTIVFDEKGKGYGYIHPKEEFSDLRFDSTVRLIAQQNNLEPKDLLTKIKEGHIFSYDPNIPLIKA